MAPHVTNLALCFINESFDSHQDKVMITKAFLTNRSLKELYFSWKAGGKAMVNVLLLVIPLANFHLTTLTLSPPATRPFSSPTKAHVAALEHFLATTTTAKRPLLHLRLSGYNFNGATATQLFSALGVSSCQFFGFPSGTMNEEATNAFVRFVNGLENTETDPNRTLSISPNIAFEGTTFSAVMVRCLSGSRLHTLRVHSAATPPDLLHGLADVQSGIPPALLNGLPIHSAITLASLKLDELSVAGVEALARFVPLSTSLVNLRVDVVADDAACRRQLARAIYQNGSLRTVVIEAISSLYGSLLTKVLQRNAKLPALLHQKVNDNDKTANGQGQDNTDVAPAKADTDAAPSDPYWNARAIQTRFPQLFCSAQEAERMAPNNMLVGLLSAVLDDDKSIGRLRPAAAPNDVSSDNNRHGATLQEMDSSFPLVDCSNTIGGCGGGGQHDAKCFASKQWNCFSNKDANEVRMSTARAVLQNRELLTKHWSLYDKIGKQLADLGLNRDDVVVTFSRMEEIGSPTQEQVDMAWFQSIVDQNLILEAEIRRQESCLEQLSNHRAKLAEATEALQEETTAGLLSIYRA